MPENPADASDRVFRALASRPRREILAMLARGTDGECCSVQGVCACDIVEQLDLGAPTVSHHMKLLIQAGLVESEKRGLWVHYRLRPEGFRDAFSEIAELLGGTDSDSDGCGCGCG